MIDPGLSSPRTPPTLPQETDRAHRGAPSSPHRVQRDLGPIQQGDGRQAHDRWEALEELIQGVVQLQLLEQRLHWHPCSAEHGRAAEDPGIDDDEIGRVHGRSVGGFFRRCNRVSTPGLHAGGAASKCAFVGGGAGALTTQKRSGEGRRKANETAREIRNSFPNPVSLTPSPC